MISAVIYYCKICSIITWGIIILIWKDLIKKRSYYLIGGIDGFG